MPARRSGRLTCETARSVDVRLWHRAGQLRTGETFTLSWTVNGEPLGGMHVRIGPSAAVLNYQIQADDAAELTPVEQEIPIVGTRCNFGGARPGFIASLVIAEPPSSFLRVLLALDVAAVVI